MKRTVIIIAVAVIIAAFIGYAAFVFLGFGQGRGAPVNDAVTTGGSAGSGASASANIGNDTIVPLSPESIPAGNTVSIGTQQGIVTVDNFYKTAMGTDGEALVLKRAAGYEIIYNAGNDSAFGIYVMSAPVPAEEAAAEQDLVSILGISQADACKLNITWSVAANIDPSSAGQSHGPTFCPGSTGL